MKCISEGCEEEMVRRIGKFGAFFYCKKHGTASEKAIFIINKLKSSKNQSDGKIYSYADNPNNDNLMLQIKRQTLGFGFNSTGLEDWIVDCEGEADYDESHWLNMRPY